MAGERRTLKTNDECELKRVLIVDDEPRILRFVSISLVAHGYEVMTATSGLGALELITSQQPDIMLLDMVIPQMSGLEVLQKLRSFSRLPVIAFSANSSLSQKALEMGADDFLDKPFMPDELLRRMEAILEHKGGSGPEGNGAG